MVVEVKILFSVGIGAESANRQIWDPSFSQLLQNLHWLYTLSPHCCTHICGAFCISFTSHAGAFRKCFISAAIQFFIRQFERYFRVSAVGMLYIYMHITCRCIAFNEFPLKVDRAITQPSKTSRSLATVRIIWNDRLIIHCSSHVCKVRYCTTLKDLSFLTRYQSRHISNSS